MMPQPGQKWTFDEAFAAFLTDRNASIEREYTREYPNLTPSRLETLPGARYVKIACVDGTGSRSACAFVEKTTGNVFKAESWSRPAKHARGSIYEPTSYASWARTGPPYLR